MKPAIYTAGFILKITNMQTIDFPRLRHFTMRSTSDEDSLSVIVGTEQYELKELLGGRNKFLEVKSYFDGRHSINEISLLTGIAKKDISQIASQFHELGILRVGEVKDTIPVKEFIDKVNDSCVMWQRQVGYHRLFGLLENKQVRKQVFIGYILETYHYVNAAAKHIGTALTHCRNEAWQKLVTTYFVDEYDHAVLYLNTLNKMGLKREQVIGAHPIIGTMSLINMLCEIGRVSSLGYIACTSLFEANKNDFEKAKQKMEAIGISYGFSPESLSDVISHMEQDIQMGHVSLLSQALEGQSVIAAEDAHIAVNCLHDLKHSYDQFHDQILYYYSDISNYIPRLKVDYFSL